MRLSTADYMAKGAPLNPLAEEIAIALTESGIATPSQAEAFLESLRAQTRRDEPATAARRAEADDEHALIEASFKAGL